MTTKTKKTHQVSSIPACGSPSRNSRCRCTLPPPPFRGDDDCLPRCPTASAVGEEEEEEEGPARTSPATTESLRY